MDGPKTAAPTTHGPSLQEAGRPPALGAGRTGPTGPRAARRAGLLGWVLTATTTAGALGLGRAALGAWPGLGPVAVDQALLTVALGAAAALALWVAGVLAVASRATLRSARTGTPLTASGTDSLSRSVRLTALALLTLASLSPVTATAAVAPATSPDVAATASVAATATSPATPGDDRSGEQRGEIPQPGWTPTPRTLAPRAPEGVGLVSTVPHEVLPDQVVVRRGDTLWGIAARHLGQQATSADIAEEWPRWYAANRDLIGADPDLILPGQELRVPGADR